MRKTALHIFFLICQSLLLRAQDPHFSQFFMAPTFINPAITAHSRTDWRLMGNLRQQWGNAGTPFNTQVFSADYKLTGRDGAETRETNHNALAVAGSMMLDQSMYGAFRSTYALGALSYKVALTSEQSLSLGFEAMYGDRTIDYSRLTFGEQFSSGGFDVTLPTGEVALSNIKPFVSLSSGLMYNYRDPMLNFSVGGAAFHLNNPKQSFFNDPNQIVPKRYVVHSDLEYALSRTTSLNFYGIYMQQALPAYFAIGGTLGWDLSGGDNNSIFYAGGWFREGDSFYPYAGWAIGNIQIGFSYDITHSKQNLGPYNPRSFEMSFVVHQKKYPESSIGTRCPLPPW